MGEHPMSYPLGRQGRMVVRRFISRGVSLGDAVSALERERVLAANATWAFWFFCPGCEGAHFYQVPQWSFNGDFAKPTFTPSLLLHAHEGGQPRCHLFLTDGRLQFLGDCTHKLAGQTVDLPEPPEWL